MGQFNLPIGANMAQQHNQAYGVGLGSADAIAASAGESQPHSEEVHEEEEQPQNDDTEELFGMLPEPISNVMFSAMAQYMHGQCNATECVRSRLDIADCRLQSILAWLADDW